MHMSGTQRALTSCQCLPSAPRLEAAALPWCHGPHGLALASLSILTLGPSSVLSTLAFLLLTCDMSFPPGAPLRGGFLHLESLFFPFSLPK